VADGQGFRLLTPRRGSVPSSLVAEVGLWIRGVGDAQQLVFDNDFSHASRRGAELWGSQNFVYNRLNDCRLALRTRALNNSLIVGNQWRAVDEDLEVEERGGNFWEVNGAGERVQYGRVASYAPEALAGGRDASLAEGRLRGRAYRLLDEWGPYDFRSPRIWLRERGEERYVFGIFGPQGNWQVADGQGFRLLTPRRGSVPSSLVAEVEPGADTLALEFRFRGAAIRTTFGESRARGSDVSFFWTNQ
ncbi:MAG: hypothetical protein AAF146_13575, partial [Bacteroidota bacterium]